MSNVWNRFGAMAARPPGKPGRTAYPSSKTIDVHLHAVVPTVAGLAISACKI